MLPESVPQLKLSLAKHLEKLGAANPGKVGCSVILKNIFGWLKEKMLEFE